MKKEAKQQNETIENNIKDWEREKQKRDFKEPRKATYYFELDKETISIRMNQKTREQLKELQDQFKALRVFTYINGCTLIYDL